MSKEQEHSAENDADCRCLFLGEHRVSSKECVAHGDPVQTRQVLVQEAGMSTPEPMKPGYEGAVYAGAVNTPEDVEGWKAEPSAEKDALSAWRENREGEWFRDIGYAFENALSQHQYDIRRRGSKPEDPGWHECSCGWEGYWSDFHPHVADHLRARVIPPGKQEGT